MANGKARRSPQHWRLLVSFLGGNPYLRDGDAQKLVAHWYVPRGLSFGDDQEGAAYSYVHHGRGFPRRMTPVGANDVTS